MLTRFAWLVAFLLAMPALQVHAAGSGGGYSDIGTAPEARSPAQQARTHYKAGLNHKKKAWKLEEKAAKAKDEKGKAKHLANAQKEYARAIERYRKAIQADNTHFEAMNELGYAFRKSGDFENAIRAYNTALFVKPDFPEAIEYRGEAFLALGLFDQTKEAYLALFRDAPEQAALLMQAMETWVTEQGTASADAAAFAAWVAERKALAGQTQTLSMNNLRRW